MSEAGERLNTRLEAEGAEFLVLAHLLIEGIQAIKAYTRFPGYDLIAADPDHGTSCRIQVKSRWATDYDRGFPISNFNCDFVVFVALNRAYRYTKKAKASTDDSGKRPPELYVLPVDLLTVVTHSGGWSKVYLRNIEDAESYRERWDLISTHLRGEPTTR